LQVDWKRYPNSSNRWAIMANKANSKDITPLRDALNMEIMINQALIDLLVAKGIITQEELMAKIEEIRKELPSGTS